MENQAGNVGFFAEGGLSGELLGSKGYHCYKYLIFWRVKANSKDAELLESYSRIYGGLDVGVKLIRRILEDREKVFEARAREEAELAAMRAQIAEKTKRLYGK